MFFSTFFTLFSLVHLSNSGYTTKCVRSLVFPMLLRGFCLSKCLSFSPCVLPLVAALRDPPSASETPACRGSAIRFLFAAIESARLSVACITEHIRLHTNTVPLSGLYADRRTETGSPHPVPPRTVPVLCSPARLSLAVGQCSRRRHSIASPWKGRS